MINKLPEGIKQQIVEYAISAWAMGSSRDVYKSLATSSEHGRPDPDPEASFVAAWAKEIDWVAENLESLVLKGLAAKEA